MPLYYKPLYCTYSIIPVSAEETSRSLYCILLLYILSPILYIYSGFCSAVKKSKYLYCIFVLDTCVLYTYISVPVSAVVTSKILKTPVDCAAYCSTEKTK